MFCTAVNTSEDSWSEKGDEVETMAIGTVMEELVGVEVGDGSDVRGGRGGGEEEQAQGPLLFSHL